MKVPVNSDALIGDLIGDLSWTKSILTRLNFVSVNSQLAARSLQAAVQVRINDGSLSSNCSSVGPQVQSYRFLILTLMTFCVLVCYTLLQLAYTMGIYFETSIPGLYRPAAVLSELITVVDPILFVLALSDLRTAFRRTYFCSQ